MSLSLLNKTSSLVEIDLRLNVYRYITGLFCEGIHALQNYSFSDTQHILINDYTDVRNIVMAVKISQNNQKIVESPTDHVSNERWHHWNVAEIGEVMLRF